MLTQKQFEIVTKYEAAYPHLRSLAANARGGSTQACKTLGDAMARVAYLPSITGLDALEIAKIGIPGDHHRK